MGRRAALSAMQQKRLMDWIERLKTILSPREYQCLRMQAEGSRIKDIASQLGISDKTVGNLLRRARLKIKGKGPRTRTAAYYRSRIEYYQTKLKELLELDPDAERESRLTASKKKADAFRPDHLDYDSADADWREAFKPIDPQPGSGVLPDSSSTYTDPLQPPPATDSAYQT